MNFVQNAIIFHYCLCPNQGGRVPSEWQITHARLNTMKLSAKGSSLKTLKKWYRCKRNKSEYIFTVGKLGKFLVKLQTPSNRPSQNYSEYFRVSEKIKPL